MAIANPFFHGKDAVRINGVVGQMCGFLGEKGVMDSTRFNAFNRFMHDNARHFLSSVEISQVNQPASEWNSFRDAIMEKFPELRKCDGDWPINVLFDGWVYHREVRARARERERNAKAGEASPKKTRRKVRKVAGDGKAERVGTLKAKKQYTGKPPPPTRVTRKRKILYVGKKPQRRLIGSEIPGNRESRGMPEPVMGPPRLFRQESGQ